MRILIVAGGTCGHLFPAIRLSEEIGLRHIGEVLFVTSSRIQDRTILRQKNLAFTTFPIIPLQSKNIFSILNFVLRLGVTFLRSLLLLLCFRPEVVIGFGGYISGPILLLASLSKTKTIIHEQNIYPGKTNRILARFVDKVAVTFPETKKYLNRYESKIIISGIPLRKEFKRESIKRDIFSVLIVGGSQGASALNRLVPEAAGLINSERKKEFEVIHISGHRDRDEVIKAYRDKDIKSEVFSFTDEIPKFYNACDFVISRAGAATVSELLFLGKPSILIPYPYAGGHQRLNAAVLRDRGIAVLLEEETLTAEILRDTVIKFMNKDILVEMSGKLKEDTVMDPCDILIKEIVSG